LTLYAVVISAERVSHESTSAISPTTATEALHFVALYSPRKKEKWGKHCILLPQAPYFGDSLFPAISFRSNHIINHITKSMPFSKTTSNLYREIKQQLSRNDLPNNKIL